MCTPVCSWLNTHMMSCFCITSDSSARECTSDNSACECTREGCCVVTGIDPSIIETWPADDQVDPEAYKTAVASYRSGDVAIVFTPDDTHFAITEECLKHGMHVLVSCGA